MVLIFITKSCSKKYLKYPKSIFMQRVFFIQQANEETGVQQYAILFHQASPPLILVNHSSAFTSFHFGVALRIKPCR